MAGVWAYGCLVLRFIRMKLFLLVSSNLTGWESGSSCLRCLMEHYPVICSGSSSLSCTVQRVRTWKSSALLYSLLTSNRDWKVGFLHSEPILTDSAAVAWATGLILCRLHCLIYPLQHDWSSGLRIVLGSVTEISFFSLLAASERCKSAMQQVHLVCSHV